MRRASTVFLLVAALAIAGRATAQSGQSDQAKPQGGRRSAAASAAFQLTNFLRFQSTMTQGGTPTRNVMQRVQQSGADLIFLFSF